MSRTTATALNAGEPWPGLAAFAEADSAFFRGRHDETAELLRLVNRETLSVLFGRSGLGKTSLLQAGLFPALRGADCLPVYLRLDHGDLALPPRDQVLQALQREGQAHRVQVPPPEGDEGLWSFFHRRDAEFWSALNRPVVPVIVLDQFEEIFTLGQQSEATRERGRACLAELADLVENRPPPQVRQRLEHDPAAAGRYRFRRSTVKLVLSFREDFLAEMEGMKSVMPSIMVNRLRLLPMDGAQAYAVVTESGGALVDDDVARRIVRLAWKNEPEPPVAPEDFPRIEIDPALLSVVCSELNHKRRHAQPPLPCITPALLAGADREILSGFYERATAGLDPRVRGFVEDELITDQGYRDSHDIDDALARPGVSAASLEALVAGRLLRVEERQGRRRLELTHDVLTKVVMASRDRRRAEEAERALAAREAATLRQQRRNRRNGLWVLGGLATVLLLAVLTVWQFLAARQERQKAEALLAEAGSAGLIAAADRLPAGEHDTALLLDIEAWRTAATLDARGALAARVLNWQRPSAYLRGHANTISSVAFSPDGQLVATAGLDEVVKLWDPAGAKLVATLDGHGAAVLAVTISRDGRHLAAGVANGTIHLWDLQTRQRIGSMQAGDDKVHAVAFSRNGQQLASGDGSGRVLLWDVATRERAMAFEGHDSAVNGVAFNADGMLASGGSDGRVMLWDASSGERLAMSPDLDGGINSLAFHPGGRELAVSLSLGHTVIWDVAAKKVVATLAGHTRQVFGTAYSADGSRLATTSRDGTVKLWDGRWIIGGKQEALATLEGHRDEVYGAAFSPDGKRLVSAGADQVAIVWDFGGGRALRTLAGHRDTVTDVAFSPDGQQLASASGDKTVALWDPAAGRITRQLEHPGGVDVIAFSANGQRLATGAKDKILRLWDLGQDQPPVALSGHEGEINGIAFSPDGQRLASTSRDDGALLWDLRGNTVAPPLDDHEPGGVAAAFSPDGRLLATAGYGSGVILWTGWERGQAHRESYISIRATRLHFDPAGRWLASTGGKDDVTLRDVSGDARRSFALQSQGSSRDLALDRDGTQMVSATDKGIVTLWDVRGRKPTGTLNAMPANIDHIALSPDGLRLATTHHDSRLVLWDLSPEHLAGHACAIADRNLSCREWRQHMGADVPYRKTCAAWPEPAGGCG